jgi:hypothetical protein
LLLIDSHSPPRSDAEDPNYAENGRRGNPSTVDQRTRLGSERVHSDAHPCKDDVHVSGDTAAAVVGKLVGPREGRDIEIIGKLVPDVVAVSRLCHAFTLKVGKAVA